MLVAKAREMLHVGLARRIGIDRRPLGARAMSPARDWNNSPDENVIRGAAAPVDMFASAFLWGAEMLDGGNSRHKVP